MVKVALMREFHARLMYADATWTPHIERPYAGTRGLHCQKTSLALTIKGSSFAIGNLHAIASEVFQILTNIKENLVDQALKTRNV